MTKICWKCGKPHADGDAFCMYCGASFATDDMKYQTDGRTVSATDDKAYLSAPPPKYKKSKVPIIVGVLVVAGVAMMALFIFGSMQSADVTYDDYDVETYYSEDKDQTGILYKMYVYNRTDHPIDTAKIYFTIEYNGQSYMQTKGDTAIIASKDFMAQGYLFVIDGKVEIDKATIKGHSDAYSIARA